MEHVFSIELCYNARTLYSVRKLSLFGLGFDDRETQRLQRDTESKSWRTAWFLLFSLSVNLGPSFVPLCVTGCREPANTRKGHLD